MQNALILFVKNPVAGKVKTRLAKSIGAEQALRVYLELLEITKQVALQSDSKRYLYYSEAIDKQDDWDEVHFSKQQQQGDDLGLRMQNAFKQTLVAGHGKVVIIGSDCPFISAELIDSAFKVLDEQDVVFGPAEDGGYYLMGMKKVHPELFEDLPWSTEKLLRITTQRLENIGLSYGLLPELFDVDDLLSYQRYKKSC